MLKVPELKPGQEPFDPDFDYRMHPGIKATDHFLQTAKQPDAESIANEHGVLLMGFDYRKDGRGMPEPGTERVGLSARDILDHAVVKDAVTSLHREDDEQMCNLSSYNGIHIDDIVRDQENFLRGQERKYKTLLANDRQRTLFYSMTRGYFEQALERAVSLRVQKIRQYQIDVIERQNQEFVDRALRPENVYDDRMQTVYRDMVLFNLENLHADLPETQRKEKLDGASEAFYRKVMDKRLESDPAQLRAMLDAPAVKRVLGDDVVNEYEVRVAAAVRDDQLEETARGWVADDLNPLAAKLEADGSIADPGEREKALDHYAYWRHNDNQKKYLTAILNANNVWKSLAEGGYRRETIPDWVRRNDPALFRYLVRQLEAWEKNGGRPSAPDYAFLFEFAWGFDPHKAGEKLREDEELYSVMERLGGSDAPAFQIALRLLLGKSTNGDRALFEDLRLARALREERVADSPGAPGLTEFLARFVRTREIKMRREELETLYDDEVLELAERCARVATKAEI